MYSKPKPSDYVRVKLGKGKHLEPKKVFERFTSAVRLGGQKV